MVVAIEVFEALIVLSFIIEPTTKARSLAEDNLKIDLKILKTQKVLF